MRWLRFLGGVWVFTALGCGWSQPNLSAQQPSGPPSSAGVSPSRTAPARNPIQPASLSRSAGAEPAELEGRVTARVMARVNGHPILVEEVENAAWSVLAEQGSQVPRDQWPAVKARIMAQALDSLIDREVVLQDAAARVPPRVMEKVRETARKEIDDKLRRRREQLQIKSDEEFRALLAKMGQSVEEIRRQEERNFIFTEYMRSRIRPKIEAIDRDQLLEYYTKHLEEFERPETVTWQHIFIAAQNFPDRAAARRHAEAIRAQAQAVTRDEEFAALAEKYSDGPSKYRKGLGEGTQRGRINADLEPLIFRLQPGQTGPIVETPQGFHIVRLIAHEPAGRVPFEKACLEIRKKLQGEIADAEFKRIIKELRSQAYIENVVAERK
jgi:parvulin-like peptidyl-prolyl isomerase